jgi:hypothetical protein
MLFACRLMELEATPGIEPGYTVLQSELAPFGYPVALTTHSSETEKTPGETGGTWLTFTDLCGSVRNVVAGRAADEMLASIWPRS